MTCIHAASFSVNSAVAIFFARSVVFVVVKTTQYSFKSDNGFSSIVLRRELSLSGQLLDLWSKLDLYAFYRDILLRQRRNKGAVFTFTQVLAGRTGNEIT